MNCCLSSLPSFHTEKYNELNDWYHVSYLWYAAIGTCFTFITGCIFSLVFRCLNCCRDEGEVDEDLLFDYAGFCYTCLPRKVAERFYVETIDVKVEGDSYLLHTKMDDERYDR